MGAGRAAGPDARSLGLLDAESALTPCIPPTSAGRSAVPPFHAQFRGMASKLGASQLVCSLCVQDPLSRSLSSVPPPAAGEVSPPPEETDAVPLERCKAIFMMPPEAPETTELHRGP